jgi:Cu+-exporting ATPase
MAQATTAAFELKNLSCAACVGRAEQTLLGIPGVTDAAVYLASAQARITGTAPLDLIAITLALSAAGYPARSATAVLAV